METTNVSSLWPSSTEEGISVNNSLTDGVFHTDKLLLNSHRELAFPLYLRLWASLASGIIFIVGISGNILVPILVWKNRQLRHSTNIFLLNLAIADVLILLVCLPTALVELHTAPNTWVLGSVLCELVPFIEITVSRASILTLTVISIERYIAICKPLKASVLCNRPRALVVCVAIWPMSFLAAGPVLVATEYKEIDSSTGHHEAECITALHESWITGYYLGSAGAFFLFPLLFLFAIYFLIARKLLSQRARSTKRLDSSHWKSRQQVALMLGAVVIIFFVCLLPFQIFIVWVIQAPAKDINFLGPHVYFNILYACRVLVYINSAANPIIYNAMSAKFRNALLKLFGRSQKISSSLRRHSTITTTLSSSSNASSRSNSFRRMARFALQRSFSDASIRRNNPTCVCSPIKKAGSFSRKRECNTCHKKVKDEQGENGRWFLKKGTSGSYFSSSTASFSTLTEDQVPLSPIHPSRFKCRANLKPFLCEIKTNGYFHERNTSLPSIYPHSPSFSERCLHPPSSPGSLKRVSFKETKFHIKTISPLTSEGHPIIHSVNQNEPQNKVSSQPENAITNSPDVENLSSNSGKKKLSKIKKKLDKKRKKETVHYDKTDTKHGEKWTCIGDKDERACSNKDEESDRQRRHSNLQHLTHIYTYLFIL